MANITLKNIPEDLYERLKSAARLHHRSINREIIACIDSALSSSDTTQSQHLERARMLRANLGERRFSSDEIVAMIRKARDASE